MSEKKENPVMSFIDTKLIPLSQRIADNKYIKCLAGGSMSLMAIILIGAVFNLLNSIGFEWYQNFIQGIGINYLFNLIYNACMNLMSVFIVYSVGFNSALRGPSHYIQTNCQTTLKVRKNTWAKLFRPRNHTNEDQARSTWDHTRLYPTHH